MIERYSEYHIVDGKIVRIEPLTDCHRYSSGYPLEIAHEVRTFTAQLFADAGLEIIKA